MRNGYVCGDDYIRMLVLLATSMAMMMVPVLVAIGNGNEAYCSRYFADECRDDDVDVIDDVGDGGVG